MKQVKAKVIVELANGPINTEADNYLTKYGIEIIPDIIANAGGVVVSYLEWRQNREHVHWSEEKVNEQLDEYMSAACKAMHETATRRKLSIKEAAFINAIQRLNEPTA